MPGFSADSLWRSSTYHWHDPREAWSSPWGGSEAQWAGSLYPRVGSFLPTGKIVEIGASFGRWAKFLIPACDSYLGLDSENEHIALCKHRFASASHALFTHDVDGAFATLPDHSVDFIFSFDFLVHTRREEMQRLFTRILSKLARGGVAFIHHSNLAQIADTVQGARSHGRADDVSAQGVRDYLEENGARIISQEIINWIDTGLTDCLTTFSRNDCPDYISRATVTNARFMEEASVIRANQAWFAWSQTRLLLTLDDILTRILIDARENNIDHVRAWGRRAEQLWARNGTKAVLLAFWHLAQTVAQEGHQDAARVICHLCTPLMTDGRWRQWVSTAELQHLVHNELRICWTSQVVLCAAEYLRRDPAMVWWHGFYGTLRNREDFGAIRALFYNVGKKRRDFYVEVVAACFMYSAGDFREAVDRFRLVGADRLPPIPHQMAIESADSLAILDGFKASHPMSSRSFMPPFVVIHNGNQDYFRCCIESLVRQNGAQNVIAIGQGLDAEALHGIRVVDIANVESKSKAFRKIYHHCAVTNYEYELFCFQRWFILSEFLSQANIDQCVMVDSDILGFSDAAQMIDVLPTDTAMSDWAWTCPIRDRNVLEQLTDCMTEIYSQPTEAIRTFIDTYGAPASGQARSMQDMTFLHMFGNVRTDRLAQLARRTDLFGFDTNISLSSGFETAHYSSASQALLFHKVKDVRWQDGRPILTLTGSRTAVPFHTLHFQGLAKILMPQYLANADSDMRPSDATKSSSQRYPKSIDYWFGERPFEEPPMRKIFLDCGGHRGTAVVHFLKEYPDYEFYCFEPNLEMFAELTRSVATHGKTVFCFPGAVWTHDGFLDFFLGHEQGSTALPGKVEVIPGLQQVDYGAAVRVPCIDLSAWILRNIRPGDELVVKMDIEGGEYQVVPKLISDGSLHLIKRFYCEWHQDRFPDISREFHDSLISQVSRETTLESWY